jgi:hypothetical protein
MKVCNLALKRGGRGVWGGGIERAPFALLFPLHGNNAEDDGAFRQQKLSSLRDEKYNTPRKWRVQLEKRIL